MLHSGAVECMDLLMFRPKGNTPFSLVWLSTTIAPCAISSIIFIPIKTQQSVSRPEQHLEDWDMDSIELKGSSWKKHPEAERCLWSQPSLWSNKEDVKVSWHGENSQGTKPCPKTCCFAYGKICTTATTGVRKRPGCGHIPEIKMRSQPLPHFLVVLQPLVRQWLRDALRGRSLPCKGSQAGAAAEAADASETTLSSESGLIMISQNEPRWVKVNQDEFR